MLADLYDRIMLETTIRFDEGAANLAAEADKIVKLLEDQYNTITAETSARLGKGESFIETTHEAVCLEALRRLVNIR